MKNFNKFRGWILSILIGSIMTIVPTSGSAQSVLYAIDNVSPFLSVVDPDTGAEESFVEITLVGEEIITSNGLAIHPITNEMYAAVRLDSQAGPGRNLIKIIPDTGVATNVGNMGQPIASLAFDSNGVLYAVSGDCLRGCGGAAIPETLFTVNTNDASLTSFQTLGNGNDGEAIAFNPSDDMMYHMSGKGVGLIFEKINLSNGVITNIPLSGAAIANREAIGFTYDAGQNLFVGSLIDWDQCFCDGSFITLSSTGFLTEVNLLNLPWKDFAYSLGPPPFTESVLLRRTADRKWFTYVLSGSDIVDSGRLAMTRSADFSVVSRADFDGDGNNDVLLRDLIGGENGRWVLYTLDGMTITSQGFADLTRNSDWANVATEDFNNDGKADVLVRNSVDGRWLLYLMDAQFVLQQGVVALSTDLTDQYIGTGDFDGDGDADVLLRRADGSWLMYQMDGLNAPVVSMPPMTANLSFMAQTIADFDANGTADLLLRRADGRWFMYLLNGPVVSNSGSPALTENVDFVFQSSSDFNGDGRADVLLRRSDGRWFMYAMNGIAVSSEGVVDMTRNVAFQIVSTQDFSGDGNADVLLRRNDGRWVLYMMDGPTILSQGIPDMARNTDWIPYVP